MNRLTALPSVRRLLRRIVPVQVPQPSWPELLGADWPRWQALVAAAVKPGQRVLLAPMVGTPTITTLDSLIAVATTLRGADVQVLLCDEELPACQNSLLDKFPEPREFLKHGPRRDICPTCFRSGEQMFRQLGIRVHRLSDQLDAADVAETDQLAATIPVGDIAPYTIDEMAIGEQAVAGAIRYFARSALEREPRGEEVLRRYFAAALRTERATRRLFESERFDVASFHHGIYVPQGVIGEVARRHKIRVVNWAISYRKNTFIFSHGDTYHHTMMTEPTASWENLEWTEERESALLEYLKSRADGKNDWISFNRKPQLDTAAIARELGVDFDKPCIGLLTNVVWDAQLHYAQNAFPNMIDWLIKTVEHFATRPELQLIIRVHPAELSGQIKSRQPVAAELQRRFPRLPANVFVIGPESPISTYSVMFQCDSVLIYGTKTGVELTSFGIPVIVAGEAWIRNKGITIDAHDEPHYREILNRLPLRRRLDASETLRARKYAFHFFFRRMIPVGVLDPQSSDGGWCPYTLRLSGLRDIEPGADVGLDTICNGILRGTDFIYRAEDMLSLRRAKSA